MSNEDVQSAKDLAAAIETLAGHGKDLAEIEGATEVLLKSLGKVSAGLGILGIGFDIALLLFFPKGPSVEDKILEAVDALSSKVDVLWGRLENEFEDLEAKNNLRAAKSGISDEISALRTLGQSVHSRNISELRKLGTFEIRKWVNNLADHASGSALHENIFKAVYEGTHGNLNQMTSTGAAMADSAIVALIATGMLQADQWRAEHSLDGKILPSVEQRQDLEEKAKSSPLMRKVESICLEFAVWQQRCVDEAEANIGKFFGRLSSKLDDLPSNVSSETEYRGVAEAMVQELHRNWSWCDWLVIVGQPTSEGSGNFIHDILLRSLDNDVGEDGKKTIIHKVGLNITNRKGKRSSVLIAARPKTRKSIVGARSFAEHVKAFSVGASCKEFSGIMWCFRSSVKWSAAWSDPINVQVGIVTASREGKSDGRVHWEKPKGHWDSLMWGSYPQ